MEFDKSKVYTALNADELKIGSKVITSATMSGLKDMVEHDSPLYLGVLSKVKDERNSARFVVDDISYELAYLISSPGEKKLRWTDLKIGDVVEGKYNKGLTFMVTGIDANTVDNETHIMLGGDWISDEDLEKYEKVE